MSGEVHSYQTSIPDIKVNLFAGKSAKENFQVSLEKRGWIFFNFSLDVKS